MANVLSITQYGYFSHQHVAKQGTEVQLWRKPDGAEVYTTGTGLTKHPEDSGYRYAQTRQLGDMKGWELLRTFTTDHDPDPDPISAHMTPTEFVEAS